VKGGVVLLISLALALSGCGESKEKALQRVARAEADMAACKKHVGLEGTPTPDNTSVFPMTEKGQPLILDPDRVAQMRLKVECLIPLSELLDARKAAGITK
jgi:hypothetical protein